VRLLLADALVQLGDLEAAAANYQTVINNDKADGNEEEVIVAIEKLRMFASAEKEANRRIWNCHGREI